MKEKDYLSPRADVISLQAQQMLCGSGSVDGGVNTEQLTGSDFNWANED